MERERLYLFFYLVDCKCQTDTIYYYHFAWRCSELLDSSQNMVWKGPHTLQAPEGQKRKLHFKNTFQLGQLKQGVRMVLVRILFRVASMYIFNCEKNQNGPVCSNIFQYEINSPDNVVLRIMSADSQHKRGLTLLFFSPTYNCLLSNFLPSGSTACSGVNMRIQFMPRVFLCQPAGSSLPLPLFLPR